MHYLYLSMCVFGWFAPFTLHGAAQQLPTQQQPSTVRVTLIVDSKALHVQDFLLSVSGDEVAKGFSHHIAGLKRDNLCVYDVRKDKDLGRLIDGKLLATIPLHNNIEENPLREEYRGYDHDEETTTYPSLYITLTEDARKKYDQRNKESQGGFVGAAAASAVAPVAALPASSNRTVLATLTQQGVEKAQAGGAKGNTNKTGS